MSEVGINISCWNFFRPFRRKHKNIQAQRKDELEVTQLGLRDRISDLPDEILCYILSFLTLRDSVRTRLLSAGWRHLCDCRSVLQFDALNVFGRKTVITVSQQSKFVIAVNQFIQLWKCWNSVHGIKINFPLGVEHTSNIDRWVRSFIRMGIKDLTLVVENEKTYLLCGNLLRSGEAFFLESLSLGDCELTLSSDCSSWISHLTKLDLFQVNLKAEDMEFILSNGLNLSSLSLVACLWSSPSPLKVELPSLKKLVVHESVDEIVLHCPNLEILECKGRIKCFKLSHLPLLSEVKLGLFFPPNGCSSIFCALTRHAPQLQALSLLVMTAKSSA
ncbi:F-box/LRR-repeat protein At3g26922-like [Silene latifolia]|uniref:F-box/LRR-repeat protein At3g26922-like n=1 Tax=Silene latifolia TaxID=37657 RepID=UPI003D780465